MKKISEQQLEKLLKETNPVPDPAWTERTREKLAMISGQSVTKSFWSRIPLLSVFNFLTLPNMNHSARLATAIGATVIVLIGGSVFGFQAAKASKPGDLLFPVDLALENVQRSMQSTPEAKARFELSVLDERTKELQQLQNEKSSHVGEAIADVQEQTNRVNDSINELEQKDPTAATQVKSDFNNDVSGNVSELTTIKNDQTTNPEDKTKIDTVITTVKEHFSVSLPGGSEDSGKTEPTETVEPTERPEPTDKPEGTHTPEVSPTGSHQEDGHSTSPTPTPSGTGGEGGDN